MQGVRVSGLSVDYRTRDATLHALRDVSFSIGPGRMLGLVGESGSGKSTVAFALMSLLAGNASVVSGRAEIAGQEFDLTRPNATAALRGRGIAMIFQDPMLSLNPVFTIGAHLLEVQRARGETGGRRALRRRAEEVLAAVKLTQPRRRLDQYPHELSGGMRQRVVIAMALLARPALLIADEPTTALDVTVEAQVMQEICALRDSIGCAVLLITHSLGLVTQYCDEVAVLYAGETMEAGPVAGVAAARAHPYTRLLLDCEVALDAPRAPQAIDNRFRVIAGELPDARQRPSGCIFRDRCDVSFDDCARIVPAAYPVGGDPAHRARCLHLRPRS